MPRSMSVVTLNTWKCDGDYRRRLALMARGLAHSAPDLVLLQESFRSADGDHDTAAYLATRLHMQCVYLPARRKPRRVQDRVCESESGLALLSRHPLGNAGAVVLPSDPADGDRWLQWVDCTVDGLELLLLNTHLSHLPSRDDLRLLQLDRILRFAAATACGRPVLLGGDLNATPGSRPLTWFARQRLFPAVAAWAEAGPVTAPSTLLGVGHSGCLDHLYRLGMWPRSACWRQVRLVLDKATAAGLCASDHAGVLGVVAI